MLHNVELVPPPLGQQSCRLCGLRRGRDEGDELWIADVPHSFERRSQVRTRRDNDGAELYSADERPWSRRHLACEPVAWRVVEAVTGVELDEPEARAVLRQHGLSLLAGDRQAATRRPWGHPTAGEVAKVRALALKAAAPPESVADPRGRCGVCGRSESTAWTRVLGVSWSDGTTAPVCAVCSELVPLPGGSLDDDLLRIRALAALAGVRPSPSLRGHGYYGFRMAAEWLQGDARYESGQEAWRFHPQALSIVRTAVRQALPELILDEVQRQVEVKALAARRARQARVDRENRPGASEDAWE